MTGLLASGPQAAFYVAAALVLLAVAVSAVVLRPVIALWALAAVFAAELATPVPLDTSLLHAGGTHIYPLDLLSVVMLLATVIFLIRQPPPARIMLPLAIAVAVFTVNLARGIGQFGLRHAVNESREWLYLLVAIGFVVAAGPWRPNFWRPSFALATALVGLCGFGLARYGLHPVTAQIVVDGQRVDPRPLTAAGALMLALALIVLLGSDTITVRRKVIFGAVLTLTLIVVQQRTVWAVLAVVFLLWAAAGVRRHSSGRHRRLAAIGGAVLAALAAAVATGLASGSVLGRSLAETTARHSTLQWRLIGWTDLLHSDHSATALLFGFPFGTGYRRTVLGAVTNVEPHSFYVAALLRLGIVGLAALVVLFWNIWTHRARPAAELALAPITVPLLLAALAVFSLTYEPSLAAAALVAGLLAWPRRAGPLGTTGIAAERPAPVLERL